MRAAAGCDDPATLKIIRRLATVAPRVTPDFTIFVEPAGGSHVQGLSG
jgi:hypothetical protein